MQILPPSFSIGLQEWTNILTSILAISLSLAFANGGMGLEPSYFIFLMAIFSITVGSGFLLHELAHKYVAIRFGCRAHFEAWTAGLVFMLALAIVPQLMGWGRWPLFLAPGAVMIFSYRQISLRESGLISAAGPLVNIILGAFFFALAMLFGDGFFGIIFSFGSYVNMMLAAFNLLPIYPLDGIKVMMWNWQVWLLMFVIAFFSTGVMGLGL
jgi:Zn-dependent protease